MPKITNPRFYHRRMFLILSTLVLLVVVSLACLAVWRHQNNKAIAADRARFEQTAQDVQVIAASLRSTNPELSPKVYKQCKTQNREWRTEPIVCQIVSTVIYGADNLASANEIITRVSGLINAQQTIFRQIDTKNAKVMLEALPLHQKKEALGKIYSDIKTGLECPLSYEIYNSATPPPTADYPSSKEILTVSTTFLCSDAAKSAHYPLVD